jgi:tetratricopeptide (TPR) repeat protein
MNRRGGWIARVLLAAGTLVVTPLVLEGVLRLVGAGVAPGLFIGGEPLPRGEVVDHRSFTRPFFGEALVRSPAPNRLPRVKPPGELRVAVLGASAAMGDPLPAYGLPRHVQALLEAAAPERPVRVINAAVTAINSHVVRFALDDVLDLEPDAVVLYLGNNEVVGPFGPGTVFSGFSESPALVRAAARFRRTRTGQVLTALRDAAGSVGGRPAAWGGMGMFTEKTVDADDPALAAVVRHYRHHLEAMLDQCARRGVPVVVSTVAVNRDAFAPLLPPAGDDRFAGAERLAVAGDRAGAWVLYQAAVDGDRLRFRADSAINAAVRAVAAERPGDTVMLVDADADFRAAYVDEGVAGDLLFVDHVHFTFAGNLRLARLLAAPLARQLGLDEAAVWALPEDAVGGRIGTTPWSEQALVETMKSRFVQPPYPGQQDHAVRMERAEIAVRRAAGEVRGSDAAGWADRLAGVAADHPGDAELWLGLARVALVAGRPDTARDALDRATVLWPHRHDPIGQRAMLRAVEQGPEAALVALRSEWSTALGGPSAPLLRYIADLLRDNRQPEAAARFYREAMRDDPRDPAAAVALGHLLVQHGRAGEALAPLDEALRRAPGHARALSQRGVALGELGRWGEAMEVLLRAVEVAPDDAEALFNLAAGSVRAGRAGEGEAALMRLLAINPVDADAVLLAVNQAWRDGAVDEAGARLAVLRRVLPGHTGLAVREALIAARAGRIDEARRLAEAPVAASPVAALLVGWLRATDPADSDGLVSPFSAAGRAAPVRPVAQVVDVAGLARDGRGDEARQRSQRARLDGAGALIEATGLGEALTRGVPLRIVAEERRGDPVLDALWQVAP